MAGPNTRWEQPSTSHGLALRGQPVGVRAGLTLYESPTTLGVRWVSQATARDCCCSSEAISSLGKTRVSVAASHKGVNDQGGGGITHCCVSACVILPNVQQSVLSV